MVAKRRRRRKNCLHIEEASAGALPFQQTTRFCRKGNSVSCSKIYDMALRERYERHRAFQENIPVGLYRTTPEGKILAVNRAMVEMFQYESTEDLMGTLLSDCYTDPGERRRILDQLIAAGKLEDVEVRFKRKNGTIFWGALSIATVVDTEADSLFFDGILQDVTERRQEEAERLNREKLQGVLEMAGAVCHELNQPVQSISGYFELLLMDIPKTDPLYGKVDKIKEQVEKIGRITSKIMNITKYETKDYLRSRIIDIDRAAT